MLFTIIMVHSGMSRSYRSVGILDQILILRGLTVFMSASVCSVFVVLYIYIYMYIF